MKCPKCQHENPETQKYCGECATALTPVAEAQSSFTETLETPSEELTTGSTFAGRYQIIEELGKGGMGKVYRVVDKELREEIALKVIKPEIASDKKTLERFSNELKLARKISHKNVGRMYELMEEKGARYITMEYVPGEDLKRLIRKVGQFSAGKTIAIAKQICEGLAEAHRMGVVHRDLKPQNVMVDEEGNARILDFGIARTMKGKGITAAGVMVGTPEYMSPEQAEVKEVDQRSDIYSLGVILYEMVTGRVPFEGETPLGIAMKHKSETPVDPRELNPQLPDDLSKVILSCMEKDKEERYQSAGEVCLELENIEKGIPTTEREIPKRKPITSREITVTFRLKKFLIPALIVVALVVVAVLISQLLPREEDVPIPSNKPSIAVIPFVDLSPQQDQEYFCDGMTDEIISKLSRFRGWKVIPRTSMMRYKTTEKDIKEIGEELGVTTILEGSISKERDDIRVNAKLIRIMDIMPLWSETYEEKLESVFTIQRDVAEEIANALKVELTPEDKELLIKKPTENLTAYDYYLKGREFYYHYRRQDNENAIELFKKALELDPNYVLAYAGLGDAYAQRTFRFGYPRRWLDSAIEVSEKAISIDPNSAEAYKALGLACEYKGWYSKALKANRRAVELNPNYKAAVGNVGWVNWLMGEYGEAMKWFKRDLALDPTDAFSHYSIGNCYIALDDYVEAEQWFERSLELQPDLVFSYVQLSQMYLAEGKYNEAIQNAQKILSADPNEFRGLIAAGNAELYSGSYDLAQQHFEKAMAIDPTKIDVLVQLGYLLWKTRRREEAQEMFNKSLEIAQEAIEQGNEFFTIPYHIAAVYAIQGNKEEALVWMKKAIDAGFRQFRIGQGDPMLENLHQDTQFMQMMAQLKDIVGEMRRRVEESH